MVDRQDRRKRFDPKHPLDSRTLKLSFWGAVVAVLAYIGPAFAAGADPDWRVCIGIFCGGLAASLGAAIGRRRGGGPLSLGMPRRRRRKPPGGTGGAAAAVLLVATLMAPSSCGHLRPETTGKILSTIGAIGSILADWCDPDVYDLDAEVCDTVLTYYTVGEVGAAIVLPYYTEPEFGSVDGQQAAPARVGVVSCAKVLAVCGQVVGAGQGGRPKRARAPIEAHRQVCEQVRTACAADGVTVEFSPPLGETAD